MLPWLLSAILAAAVLYLGLRLWLLHRDLQNLGREFAQKLEEDSNVGISLSTGDPYVRALAAQLDKQLKLLRKEHLKYIQGDRELKTAVTGISHDLRTPLTAIRGYLDLLEREDKSPAAARYLQLIAGRAEAMTRLTEELFRYSVIYSTEALQLEPVDLTAALEESIAGFYGPLRSRGIVPTIRLPGRPVIRRLDRTALARVLGNILSNALKYSGGDLEIILTETGEIAFVNTAPGLSQVQVGRLFDRFFTVEAARNATGLGLSIAKTLAERMDGTIAAEYESDRLTIRVRFGPQPGAESR